MKANAQQNQKPTPKKSGKKYAKPVIIAAVCLVVVIVAAAILPKALSRNTASTRITTYNVDKISYGNVTETISSIEHSFCSRHVTKKLTR